MEDKQRALQDAGLSSVQVVNNNYNMNARMDDAWLRRMWLMARTFDAETGKALPNGVVEIEPYDVKLVIIE